MADNSIREYLIESVVDKLKTIADIKSVKRKRPTLEQLKSLASTQLPMFAVTAGLPVPDIHWNEQNPTRRADKFKSKLIIEAVYYNELYDDEKYDSKISSLVDDLWVLLQADQTWGGYAVKTVIMPDEDVAVWDPYLAFKMKLTITYIHGIGGV